jgi:ubiquitin carboxyl-terminal hydrolase 36/42
VTCEYQSHVRRALDAAPGSSFSIGKLTNAINKIGKLFVRGRQEDSHEYIRGREGRGSDAKPHHSKL